MGLNSRQRNLRVAQENLKAAKTYDRTDAKGRKTSDPLCSACVGERFSSCMLTTKDVVVGIGAHEPFASVPGCRLHRDMFAIAARTTPTLKEEKVPVISGLIKG
jgi:hypothetical protein